MKKLIGNTPTKIAAFILSLFFVGIFAFSTLVTILMLDYQVYFSSEKVVKSEVLGDMATREADFIAARIDNGVSFKEYYKNKNVYFEIENKDGELIDTNYGGEKYIAVSSAEYYTYEIVKDEYDYIYSGDVSVYIAEDMKHSDIFSLAASVVSIGYKLQYFMIVIALVSFGLAVTVISYLFCAAGHSEKGEIRLNFLDKLPLALYICVLAAAVTLTFVVFDTVTINSASALALICLPLCVDYFLGLGFLLSVATRIKTKTLLKNTIVFRVLRGIYLCFRKPFGYVKYSLLQISFVKKAMLYIAVVFGAQFIFIVIYFLGAEILFGNEFIPLMFPIILTDLIFICLLMYLTIVLKRIKEGGERIAKGDLEHKIDTQYMLGDFKDFADSLNNINNSLQTAVDERMKSERFKVELITNVSHDIKTPLTSIINYVDLIKKEETKNEKIKGYIDILDRQSGRLKKLVEDLVEASKASSGNLSVELSNCNIGVLLNQAIGEFEDRLNKARIRPIIKMEDNGICVLADGRHLWRVFDNLLSNVCKYAMPDTRLYIDVKLVKGGVEVIFRNISKYELDIRSEELTERFIRGDKSRNTEGHGLGLSIAESLMELQGGNLEVSVDGDLFKATVFLNSAIKSN